MGYLYQELNLAERPLAVSLASAAVAGLLVQYASLILFAEAFLMPPVSASILGFLAGATVHYLAGRHSSSHSTHRSPENEAKFVATAWVGVMLNSSVMCLVAIMAGMHYLPAQIAATCIVQMGNGIAGRFWKFTDETARVPAAQASQTIQPPPQ